MAMLSTLVYGGYSSAPCRMAQGRPGAAPYPVAEVR